MGFENRDLSRDMGKLAKPLFIVLFAFFLFPKESFCRFYKYVDKNGTVHYVDSKSKIPKEYRQDLTVYEEKYDHLSEEEREKRIEEDRRKAEELRIKREEAQKKLDQEWEEREEERLAEEARLEKEKKARLEQERLEKEQTQREEFLKNFETKIEIVGYGQALVPCTLEYKKKEIEVLLLLDTGCTYTTLHEDIAKELRLKGRLKGEARIAGGGEIDYTVAKLDCFKVGPYKEDDFYVTIIKTKDSNIPYKGLLGMNFLASREYKIDYVRKVLRWVP